MAYKIKTQPASEPITLAEAKLHLRVDGSVEDDLLNWLIKSVREQVEKYTNRSIIEQTWYLYLDRLPDEIYVWHGPVSSITSVKYYDSDNTLQTLTSTLYDEDIASEPARITRAYSATYPSVYDRTNAVVVEFVAGMETIPSSLKAAMMLILGHLYENRENVIVGSQVNELPKGAEYLLDPFRIFEYE